MADDREENSRKGNDLTPSKTWRPNKPKADRVEVNPKLVEPSVVQPKKPAALS